MAARTDDSDYFLSLSTLDDAPLLGDADDTVRGVVLVTLGGLLLRLLALGARPAHFDEGRVAYFTEYFVRTGAFEYRSIIHGPFIQHVNSFVFSVIGPTDFASRLVVALVGTALPVTALLLRRRLRDTETLALAFFLAFSPLLVYYSRFSRSVFSKALRTYHRLRVSTEPIPYKTGDTPGLAHSPPTGEQERPPRDDGHGPVVLRSYSVPAASNPNR